MPPNRPRTPSATQFLWLAHGLLLLTVYGSIIPLRYEPMPLDRAVDQFMAMRQYDPSLVWARGDWVVNMAQYAAMSFCYMAALCVDRRWAFGVGMAVVVVPLGVLAAGAIEFLQVSFPPRTVSINDIQVESAGIVAGVVGWLVAGPLVVGWLRRFWGMTGLAGLARQALPAYGAALLVASLMPFDFVLSRSEIALKVRQGRVALVPFAGLASGDRGAWVDLVVNFLTFAPLGVLVALLPGRRWRSWPAVLALGLAVTVPIELLQLNVFTRYCDPTDVPTGAAAVLLGWWLARVLADRGDARRLGGLPIHDAWAAARRRIGLWGPARWGLLAVAWGGLLALASWYPFDFTADPSRFRDADPDLTDEQTSIFLVRRMSWAPFVDYYWGSRYNALDNFLRRSLAAAPIGALIALACGRRERIGGAATVLGTLLLGVLIEAGQFFIPDRHPGTSDVLIHAFGAWLGFRLTRHVAHALDAGPEAVDPGRGWSMAGGPGSRQVARPIRWRAPSRRLAGRADGLVRWLGAQPIGVQYAIIGGAAIAVSTGALLLLVGLGLL